MKQIRNLFVLFITLSALVSCETVRPGHKGVSPYGSNNVFGDASVLKTSKP